MQGTQESCGKNASDSKVPAIKAVVTNEAMEALQAVQDTHAALSERRDHVVAEPGCMTPEDVQLVEVRPLPGAPETSRR